MSGFQHRIYFYRKGLMMVIAFVDTNFFFQCKNYKDLIWDDLLKGETEITIMIPAVVCDEIDKFKGQSNSRRGKISRDLNSLFDKIIFSSEDCYSEYLINSKITIYFKLCDDYSKEELECFSGSSGLSRNDHFIVASLRKFVNDHDDVSDSVVFITGDTNPRRSVKSSNIRVFKPPTSWTRPIENDDKDKMISKLENEIKELKSHNPSLNLSIRPANDQLSVKTDFLFFSNHYYIDDINYNYSGLSSYLATIFPRAVYTGREHFKDEQEGSNKNVQQQNFGFSIVSSVEKVLKSSFKFPSKDDYKEYEAKYGKWLEDIENSAKDYLEKCVSRKNHLHFKLSMSNSGFVPIDNFSVSIEIQNGIIFTLDDYEEYDLNRYRIPPPPKAPEVDIRINPLFNPSQLSSISRLDVNNLYINPYNQTTKHKNVTYRSYKNRREQIQFTCEEFLHGMDPYENELVLLPFNDDVVTFNLLASGSNLRNPLKVLYVIRTGKHIECNPTVLINELLGFSFPGKNLNYVDDWNVYSCQQNDNKNPD